MLSEREWALFERDGFLELGPVMSEAELEALGRRMDEIMLGRVRYEGMIFQLDSETGAYRDIPTGQPRRAVSACCLDAATRHVRSPEYRFPIVFGEGALRPEAAVVQTARRR